MNKNFVLSVFAFLAMNAGAKASECHIKEVEKAQGFFLNYSHDKSVIEASSEEDCTEKARLLLGHIRIVNLYIPASHTKTGHTSARTIHNVHFLTYKVKSWFNGRSVITHQLTSAEDLSTTTEVPTITPTSTPFNDDLTPED